MLNLEMIENKTKAVHESISIIDGFKLTPWSKVIEKPTVTQLVKQLPASSGTRRYITVLIRARHRS
jgi:hypothetical protein